MASPFRTFVYMTAFFAAGAVVILFARGPQGLPAMQQKWNAVRQGQIENMKVRQDILELEEEAKRLRNPSSEETDLLIRDQLQRQKKGEMRFKSADPAPVGKDKRLPLVVPQSVPR